MQAAYFLSGAERLGQFRRGDVVPATNPNLPPSGRLADLVTAGTLVSLGVPDDINLGQSIPLLDLQAKVTAASETLTWS